MPSKNWFLSLRGESIGPLAEPVLLQLIRHGRVLPSDQARCDERGAWKALETFAEFGKQSLSWSARVILPNGSEEPVLDLTANAVRLPLKAAAPRDQEFKFLLLAPELGERLELTGLGIHDKTGGEQTLWIELTRLNPAHRRRLQAYVQSQNEKKSAA